MSWMFYLSLISGLCLGLGFYLSYAFLIKPGFWSWFKVWRLLILYFLVCGWTVRYLAQQHRAQIKESMIASAITFSQTTSFLGHGVLNKETQSTNTIYLQLIELQKRWLQGAKRVVDIYTMKKALDSKVYLLVDSETDYNGDGTYDSEREARTRIGEIYDRKLPELEAAFSGQVAFTDTPYSDRWGTWVSVFVPLYTKDHHLDGILGVDFFADVFEKELFEVSVSYIVLFLLLYLLSLFLGHLYGKNKVINQNLESALRAAEESQKVKTRFIAVMSHEIRTPLNGIIGPSEFLQTEESISKEGRLHLRMIKNSAKQLLELVNDILDFSKLESRGVQLEKIPFDINEIVSEVLDMLAYKTRELQTEIFFEPSAENSMILGDPIRIKQIVLNLTSNAIKFSNKKPVRVSVMVAPDVENKETEGVRDSSSRKGLLIFKVEDQGFGMSVAQQQLLFKNFSQVDASTTRQFGGTGLGLAICKGLVDLMGGTIGVDSAPEKGSTFLFKIPVVLAGTEAISNHPIKKQSEVFLSNDYFSGRTVVVTDDLELNRITLSKVLSSLGFHVLLASSAAETIELAKSSEFTIELIFMDLMMPQMDGIEATLIIKKIIPEVMIICSSATSDDLTMKRCREVGMIGFLTKPYRKMDLLNLLKSLFLVEPSGRKGSAES